MLVFDVSCQTYAVSPLCILNVLAGGPNAVTTASTFCPTNLFPRLLRTSVLVAAHPANHVALNAMAMKRIGIPPPHTDFGIQVWHNQDQRAGRVVHFGRRISAPNNGVHFHYG